MTQIQYLSGYQMLLTYLNVYYLLSRKQCRYTLCDFVILYGFD